MFLNVRNLEFQHSARFGQVLKLSGNTFFDIAVLLSLFSDLRELEGIDFRSDFRSKNDFFRNFFSDLKSAPKITYTHCPFLLNIYSVQKIKNPTWLSLFIGEHTVENRRWEYDYCEFFRRCEPYWIQSGADNDRFDYTLVVLE